MKRPVACGWCCRYSWQSVDDLNERFPFQAARSRITDEGCPLLTKTGCSLPRKERPKTCRTFICDLGHAVLKGEVTLEWAKAQLAEKENNPIYVWNDYSDGQFQTLLTEETWNILKERNQKNENRKTER